MLLHIIGMQEVRNSKPCGMVANFLTISSLPDEKGNFGCDIWIATNRCVVKRGTYEVLVAPKDCFVVHSVPRLLVVLIQCDWFQCVVVS